MAEVKDFVASLLDTDLLGFIKTSKAGNITKEKIKANEIPIVIIHPKSITGRISLTTRELKATMVVIAV